MGAGGEGLEDVDVVPGNVVSGGEGVMSWSRFHVKNVLQESSTKSKALINAKTARSIIFVRETGL